MSDPIPINASAAAQYLRIDDAEVSYDDSFTQQPTARVILNGGGVGQKGQTNVPVVQGLNVLTDEQVKKGIIQLDDLSIVTDATIEFPAVVDDDADAYSRLVYNNT